MLPQIYFCIFSLGSVGKETFIYLFKVHYNKQTRMRNFSLIFDTNRREQQIEFPRKKNICKQYRFCIRSVNVSLTWRANDTHMNIL